MKNFFIVLNLFTIILYTTSCESNHPSEEEVIEGVLEPFTDDANAEVTAADTSSTGVYQEEVIENEEVSLQDALKANSKEEVVEENGMSFCDCVKKQKELSDLMMETEDDAVFKQAITDLEELKTGDCKILFATQQNTIEEKQAHERKVKRCLKK